MRPDVLTLAIIIFVVGLLLSTFSVSDAFPHRSVPAPHQQGFALD